MDDQTRHSLNTDRLQKAWAGIRPKFAAVLSDMEGKGWRPVVAFNIHRTVAEQAQLVHEGKSKVLYSFHNVTAKDGSPESLAMDVYDISAPYNEPLKFFLHLYGSAKAHGLHTGSVFGLNHAQVARLDRMVKLSAWDDKLPLGWDKWHVEPADITIAQAKAGQRPHFK